MKTLKQSWVLIFLLVTLFIFGCSGKTGPIGPPGPEGQEGPEGPGTRIVYQSTTPIPNDFYIVTVPEIDVKDMPLVSVYIRLAGNPLWYELPTYFEGMPDFGQICFFTDREVTFLRCRGWFYQIVIVI